MRSTQTPSKSSSQQLLQSRKRTTARPAKSRLVARGQRINSKSTTAKNSRDLGRTHEHLTEAESLPSNGPLFDPMRLRWPEMAEYAFSHFGHELRLFREQATREELESIEAGRVEFSLLNGSSVLFLLYRIHPTEAWSYVPVSWWLLCNKQRTLPSNCEPDPLITVSLINARNGRICSKCDCLISSELNQALIAGLSAQSGRPYDFLEMSQQLQLAYRENVSLSSSELSESVV